MRLLALLLWLAAAANPPAPGLGPEEAAMTPPTGACAAAGASVTLASVEAHGHHISAKGTWSVSGEGRGVLLEARTDSDRRGSWGSVEKQGGWVWEYEIGRFNSFWCGDHTLRLWAFPVVKEGELLAHCLDQAVSDAKPFFVNCGADAALDGCAWSCVPQDGGAVRCTGTCDVSASGGKPPYRALWRVGKTTTAEPGPPGPGPWKHAFECAQGEPIQIVIRDLGGGGQPSQTLATACGTPVP